MQRYVYTNNHFKLYKLYLKTICFFQSDREDILRILCDKFTLSDNINFYNIAVETENFTGADLYGLLYSALRIAEKKLIKGKNIFSFKILFIK